MGNSKLKPDGWHSRRHETDEAQNAARERYQRRAEERPGQHWDPHRKCWVRLSSERDAA